jgi:hypothetical protein
MTNTNRIADHLSKITLAKLQAVQMTAPQADVTKLQTALEEMAEDALADVVVDPLDALEKSMASMAVSNSGNSAKKSAKAPEVKKEKKGKQKFDAEEKRAYVLFPNPKNVFHGNKESHRGSVIGKIPSTGITLEKFEKILENLGTKFQTGNVKLRAWVKYLVEDDKFAILKKITIS